VNSRPLANIFESLLSHKASIFFSAQINFK
jgi:hypothetical protein